MIPNFSALVGWRWFIVFAPLGLYPICPEKKYSQIPPINIGGDSGCIIFSLAESGLFLAVFL